MSGQPSWPLMVTSVLIMAVGVAKPFTHLGSYLGFTAPPTLYWPLLALTLLCYVVLTQLVKTWLLRRKWI
jgi:P-type Mg2+ transporter